MTTKNSIPSWVTLAELARSSLELAANFKDRCLYIVGDIDAHMAYHFMVPFHVMDGQKGPITVVLSSTGGGVEDGYAIYDTIKAAQNEVSVIGVGSVHSMAAVILQAGRVRLLTPECRFMVHNGSFNLGEVDADTLVAIGKEVDQGNRDYQRILAQRSGLSLRKMQRLCETETYLDARRAVKLGFADAVVLPEGTFFTKEHK